MMKKKENKYLFLYLGLTFGISWGLLIIYLVFSSVLQPIFGDLKVKNPIIIVALYAPTISGFITYFVQGGFGGVKALVLKLIPRKQDLKWFPIIFVVIAIYGFCVRLSCIVVGIAVPEMTYSIPRMFYEAFLNLFEEVGLIGGAFGWYGFLLPYLQKKLKSNIKSGVLTGLIFGIQIMPGYVFSSFETATLYPFYVTQLMIFSVIMAYILNNTKGNFLFFIYSFWLVACCSRLNIYYFVPNVQVFIIVYFLVIAIFTHYVIKKKGMEQERQVFPDYIYE